ncbi:MAG: ABC transporter permease, partial [Gemmatimonadota bacterium]|nr:ABC transporter permease [Gemmatimonadota bacterium]
FRAMRARSPDLVAEEEYDAAASRATQAAARAQAAESRILAESALIALVGGIVGALLALPINGIVTSTTNWASFSEIAFSFRVTPGLLLAGICFALVMGLVGGFFPAWRAARMPVVQALR